MDASQPDTIDRFSTVLRKHGRRGAELGIKWGVFTLIVGCVLMILTVGFGDYLTTRANAQRGAVVEKAIIDGSLLQILAKQQAQIQQQQQARQQQQPAPPAPK